MKVLTEVKCMGDIIVKGFKEELDYSHVDFLDMKDDKVINRHSIHIEDLIKVMEHFGYEVNEIE